MSTPTPGTYRGRDILWWIDVARIWDQRHNEVEDLIRTLRLPSPQLIGAPTTLDLNALYPRGQVGLLEALLLDEGVFVQPVDQLGAEGADDPGLHIVDVGVDEARADQGVREVAHLDHVGDRPLGLLVGAEGGDLPVLADDQRVLDVPAPNLSGRGRL
jgi:hypothetical protein